MSITLMFQLLPIPFWLILVLLFLRPLRLGRTSEILMAAAMFAMLSKFTVFRLIGHNFFNPILPGWVINACGWLEGSMWLLCSVTVLGAAIAGAARLCGKRFTSSRLPAMAGAAGSFALAGYGVWEGVRTPSVRRRILELEGLPAEFDGLKIAHLSDLHASPTARADKIRAIVERTNAITPDIICITGDFVDGPVSQRVDDLRPLSDLRATIGVFGCSGNHEYYSGYSAWMAQLRKFGIRMLENSHETIARGNAQIAIGGVCDAAMPPAVRNVRAAFAGAPSAAYRILMEHRPVDCALNAAAGVRLQLSGHTHGGAIVGIDKLLVAGWNENHLRGTYREGALTLHVSPGTGQWAGSPMRIGVPAEITELILQSKK